MARLSLPSAARSLSSAVLVGLVLVPLALADGDHLHGAKAESQAHNDDSQNDAEYPPTYFALADHANLIYAHIALMTIAWVFILPIAVMFSLAKSRYTLASQFVFLATNSISVFLALIYNSKTPDLYPGNAHHKIGWIITWVVTAQVLISLIGRFAGAAGRSRGRHGSEEHAFLPVSTRPDQFLSNDPYRLSGDSGQGTEPNTESLRSNSVSTIAGSSQDQLTGHHKEYEEDDLEDVDLAEPASQGYFTLRAAKLVTLGIWRYFDLTYKVIDRIILPFGSIAYFTGIITFARFFEGRELFSGLAHWTKGGVFFWLGLFTLGRWSGSFAEWGWAWNARPKTSHRWRPSAEFVESALIFFYGGTNIFLEHLGKTDNSWSSEDLEHVSITVLFIGGGLVS
jgi:hypothetical protein